MAKAIGYDLYDNYDWRPLEGATYKITPASYKNLLYYPSGIELTHPPVAGAATNSYLRLLLWDLDADDGNLTEKIRVRAVIRPTFDGSEQARTVVFTKRISEALDYDTFKVKALDYSTPTPTVVDDHYFTFSPNKDGSGGYLDRCQLTRTNYFAYGIGLGSSPNKYALPVINSLEFVRYTNKRYYEIADGYTATFKDSNNTELLVQGITTGQKATMPIYLPTPADKQIDGYYTDSSFTTPYDFNTVLSGNITIYVKFNPIATHGLVTISQLDNLILPKIKNYIDKVGNI